MDNYKCSQCDNDTWTITKSTHIKSYSPIPKEEKENYKWVEVERKEDTPIVECSKCGGREVDGYDIKVKKVGRGYKVFFQSRGFDKFI